MKLIQEAISFASFFVTTFYNSTFLVSPPLEKSTF
jgi:hypothetical protein